MSPILPLLLLTAVHPGQMWIVPQPQANVWTTLARVLNQDHICLSASSVSDPMSTCLVGIPSKYDEFPPTLAAPLPPVYNPLSPWSKLIDRQAVAEKEPQEFELLGSAKAFYCVQFTFTPKDQVDLYHEVKQFKVNYTAKIWCKKISQVGIPSTPDNKPRALPKGFFLICGDRAWAGIPSRLIGGPCTIGKLSLFTPNKTQIMDWRTKTNTRNSARKKRDLRNLDPNCDSEIVHWSKPKGVAITVFLPWVSAAKALGELSHLECWVAKQANITSAALSDLLADDETTRQATLQNRAAIDFLLLLHNHRCEEFEGLCCLNLSSKAENVHKIIGKMQQMVQDIKQETADWMDGLFQGWGLSGWVKSILKSVFLVLLVLLVILISFGIIKSIVTKLISKAISPLEVNQVTVPTSSEEGTETSAEFTKQPWFADA
uniref:uncharacterized protein LOC129118529 n=1 Tax=Agelaius phoeniceus TaxID=39638 RepID=UPI0023EBBB26|nr:uncharacterized protein LOC129118529 [Agelaius phoeniceus]XP_054485904.1 uncharacterized protein LOC129118529 [Agelaius phoeniceus]XP_054485905.1 uncharacterized protein LOC129118529 [Agelaius phoeniceus]